MKRHDCHSFFQFFAQSKKNVTSFFVMHPFKLISSGKLDSHKSYEANFVIGDGSPGMTDKIIDFRLGEGEGGNSMNRKRGRNWPLTLSSLLQRKLSRCFQLW